MAKDNRSFMRDAALLALLTAAYVCAARLGADAACYILLPLNAFAAAGILLCAYLKSDRSLFISKALILFALGCAAWGFASILWAIKNLSGSATDDATLMWLFYALTNAFFLASVVISAAEQFKKWFFLQFAVDVSISVILTVYLFWLVFLDRNAAALKAFMALDITSLFSLATDVLIVISIAAMYLSIRKGRIPGFIRVFSLGLILFALTDVFYYHAALSGQYIPNSWDDIFYLLSMNVIALGALIKIHRLGMANSTARVSNVGGNRRWVYLLLYPTVYAVSYAAGFSTAKVTAAEIVGGVTLSTLYMSASWYIRVSVEKEALLTSQNKQLEERVAEQTRALSYLANQDTLTALYNRRYFLAHLEEATRSAAPACNLVVILLDLDRFKAVNDMYGHNVGDEVLIRLSRRLIDWNRMDAVLARLGGNEFALLFSTDAAHANVEPICQQLVELCGRIYDINDNRLTVTASVGAVSCCKEIRDAKTLMKDADIALYRAKALRGNRYQLYDRSLEQDYLMATAIENLLRTSDFEKEFQLYYQPLFALPDLKLIGAEALLRWQSAEYGFISPGVFIPIAEEINRISRIGDWVMRAAAEQAEAWNRPYLMPLKIGFNISPKQFADRDFTPRLDALLKSRRIDPSWIDVEITENAMLQNVETSFAALRELGVTISIDDFGAGYSSLNYLSRYAFDRIKLDKMLVDNLFCDSGNGEKIVRAAVAMAHSIGIPTIAEGVETREQLDALKKMGCDQIQGFLMGRPAPAETFERLYIKNRLKV